MRRWFTLFKILLLCIACPGVYETYGQGFSSDTSSELASLHNAINLYHSSLSPETGLYDGSQYTYDAYYPTVISDGHPFFQSQRFDTGAVFYNNLVYENVPLLYDIIKGELLINDPTKRYIIKLNNEKVKWFIISDHRFVHIMETDSKNNVLNPGYYEVLYEGSIVLLKKNSKTMKENIAAVSGKDAFIVETDEYFIQKDDQYFKVSSRKSLVPVVESDKKKVDQFIKKNRLNFKKNKEDALTKIVAYYDSINNPNTKVAN